MIKFYTHKKQKDRSTVSMFSRTIQVKIMEEKLLTSQTSLTFRNENFRTKQKHAHNIRYTAVHAIHFYQGTRFESRPVHATSNYEIS
jgi:hypothetical protein